MSLSVAAPGIKLTSSQLLVDRQLELYTQHAVHVVAKSVSVAAGALERCVCTVTNILYIPLGSVLIQPLDAAVKRQSHYYIPCTYFIYVYCCYVVYIL